MQPGCATCKMANPNMAIRDVCRFMCCGIRVGHELWSQRSSLRILGLAMGDLMTSPCCRDTGHTLHETPERLERMRCRHSPVRSDRNPSEHSAATAPQLASAAHPKPGDLTHPVGWLKTDAVDGLVFPTASIRFRRHGGQHDQLLILPISRPCRQIDVHILGKHHSQPRYSGGVTTNISHDPTAAGTGPIDHGL